jgi:hypothetical protein
MQWYTVQSGGDPSLVMQPGYSVPGVGPAQGPPGQFPQFPNWATFQNANLPPTVIAWVIMAGLLVVTLRLTLRWQG